MNLKDRLQAIKTIAKKQDPVSRRSDVFPSFPSFSHEWAVVTEGVLQRTEYVKFDRQGAANTTSLALLVPDFLPCLAEKGSPLFEPLVFFDLETTGLSSGAGTIAFLAAFGRFENAEGANLNTLKITQYLLLDYPAERGFWEVVLPEFGVQTSAPSPRSALVKANIVTYNGKCFDFQVLRSRCFMNCLEPPIFNAVDILHPCRRLWRRLLPSCSQLEIERAILGLERLDDISGSFAPEIWFYFLKTGETDDLLRICAHNQKDIFGMASIFTALENISRDPLGALPYVDRESMALRWRETLRRRAAFLAENCEGIEISRHWEMSRRLLEATEDCPRSAFALAGDLFKDGHWAEGRKLLVSLGNGGGPVHIKARALRYLAFDAERHLRDTDAALAYLEAGLALETNAVTREGFECRRNRLMAKRGS